MNPSKSIFAKKQKSTPWEAKWQKKVSQIAPWIRCDCGLQNFGFKCFKHQKNNE